MPAWPTGLHDTEPGKDTPAPARGLSRLLLWTWSRSSTSVDAVGWAGGGYDSGVPLGWAAFPFQQPSTAATAVALLSRPATALPLVDHGTDRICNSTARPVTPEPPAPWIPSHCHPDSETLVHTSLLSGASPAPDSDCEAWRERQAWHDPDDRSHTSGPIAARCR